MKPLPVLTVASLYPNAAMPGFAPFVEHRVRRLVEAGVVETRVLAPVPWAPALPGLPESWRRWTRVPPAEVRHGIPVFHPRYPHLPRIGMTLQPGAMAAVLRREAARLWREGFRFALVDAHYAYPDGVAALDLARRFGVPLVVTARGTDLNLIPRHPPARRRLERLAREADALVAVSRALAAVWRELGALAQRVHVVPNGVDLDLFRPLEREAARAALGLGPGPLLLSVGELSERKGMDVAVRTLARLPGWRLVLVGGGPLRERLAHLARELGVAERLVFVGARPQAELPLWYAACDVFLLASRREGLPNVVLEALACGRPVVAARVWGVPEAVREPVAGRLVDGHDPAAFAAAVREVAADPPGPEAVRATVVERSWEVTVRRLADLFRELAGGRP